MFSSLLTTGAKAIMATPAFEMCGVLVMAMTFLVGVGFLSAIAYERATLLIVGWQDARRRKARRASFRRRYGVRA